jgi:hypothetical protein
MNYYLNDKTFYAAMYSSYALCAVIVIGVTVCCIYEHCYGFDNNAAEL